MKEGYNPVNIEDKVTEVCWSGDMTVYFNDYERGRIYLRPVNREIVKEVLSTNFSKKDEVLEIGSGLGELIYNLVPEYKNKIQQSDAIDKTVEMNRAKHRDSNIVKANVYRLPFEDETFDGVVGFSSFDTFGNLNAAIKEMKRVIKPGGKLIHFLDLSANDEGVLANFMVRGETVPFRLKEIPNEIDMVQLVSKEYFDTLIKKNPELEEDLLRTYMRSKKNEAGVPSKQSGACDEEWIEHYKQAVEAFDTAKFPVLDVNKCFYNELKRSLVENGLSIKRFGEVKKHRFLKRDMNIFKDVNGFIVESLGTAKSGLVDEGRFKHQAFVQTIVHVMVAEKE